MTVICFTYIGHGYYSSVSHSGFPAAIWAEGSVWLAVDKSRVARLSHEKWVSGYAPINVKPYYTPPGVHKGEVGIWQYKIWNPHPLGHTLLSNVPASFAYAMGFDNFEFMHMSKLYPWGNWLASNLPALPHYTPGGV